MHLEEICTKSIQYILSTMKIYIIDTDGKTKFGPYQPSDILKGIENGTISKETTLSTADSSETMTVNEFLRNNPKAAIQEKQVLSANTPSNKVTKDKLKISNDSMERKPESNNYPVLKIFQFLYYIVGYICLFLGAILALTTILGGEFGSSDFFLGIYILAVGLTLIPSAEFLELILNIANDISTIAKRTK